MKEYYDKFRYFQIAILTLFIIKSAIWAQIPSNSIMSTDGNNVKPDGFSRISHAANSADIALNYFSFTDSIIVSGLDTLKFIRPGEVVNFTIVVQNLSADTAQNLRLVNYLPDVLNFQTGTRQPDQIIADSLLWFFDVIAPLDSISIKYRAQCVVVSNATQNIYPSAKVIVDDDPDLTNNFVVDTLAILAQKQFSTDLALILSSETDSSIVEDNQPFNAASPGMEFRYNIEVHNLTENNADSLVITQILPPDVAFIKSSIPPLLHEANYLTWIFSGLEGDDVAAWSIDVIVDADIPENIDEIISFATFSCSNDTASINNSYTETVKIIRPNNWFVDVGVEISVETDTSIERAGITYPAVFENEPFQYSIRVYNAGSIEAETLQVVQKLAEEVTTFAQHPPLDRIEGNSLYWNLPLLGVGKDTTILIQASGVSQVEEPLFSSAQISTANEIAAANNLDSVAVWILKRDVKTPINFDLSVEYDVLADSTILIDGIFYNAVRYSDSFDYFLNIHNNGPATAYNVRVQNEYSTMVSIGHFSHPPQDIIDANYFWQIDSLRSGESWSLNTIANVKELITEFPCPIISSSTVHAQNDTLPENNSKEAIIYILGDLVHLPDLSVRQSIAVDSFETIDAVSLPVVVQDATYPITIQLSNWSLMDGENVSLTYIVDDSMEIIGANPSPDMYSPDSVVWRFARLASNHSLRFSVDVLLSEIMPVSRNLLHNKASVSAENEKAAQRDNNQSVLTMVNYGVAVEPFEPILEVSPEIASVSDSIRIRVFFPVEIVDWDLWIYLPTGEILTDFADIFIETTVIEPGRWYDIDLPYLHRTLLGNSSSDDILFELRATGHYGSSGIARHHIMVNPDFDLVPPNVIPPGSADIPIDFVVSSGHVEMKLYDVAGRHIADLVDENYQAGRHTLVWNGMTENGQLVGSGVYLITLRTEEANTWKKIIIVR